jgi:mRNA interferase MazF
MIRGEVWWMDFGLPYGSMPGFRRPALVIQNDALNQSEINTTIAIPITSNLRLADMAGNVFLDASETKLSKDSVIITPQIGVIDKSCLLEKISKLGRQSMAEVEKGILFILGFSITT